MTAIGFKIGCLTEQQFLGLMIPPANDPNDIHAVAIRALDIKTLRLLSALESNYGQAQRNPLLLNYLKKNFTPFSQEFPQKIIDKIVNAFTVRFSVSDQKKSLSEVQDILDGKKIEHHKSVDVDLMRFIKVIDEILNLKSDQKLIDILSSYEGNTDINKLVSFFQLTHEKIELFLQDYLLSGGQEEQQNKLLKQLKETMVRIPHFLLKMETDSEHCKEPNNSEMISQLRETIVKEIIAHIHLEIPPILHEDDFIVINEGQNQPVILFNDSLFLNVATSLKAARNTLTKLLRTFYGPDVMKEFCKNNSSIAEEFYYPIQHLLTPGTRLQSNDIKLMLEYLQIVYPETIDLILECLLLPSALVNGRYPSQKVAARLIEYSEKNPHYCKRRYLVIPFTYPTHIVILMVDFKEKLTIFYDSQGCPSSAYCRKIYKNFDMREELEKIQHICFPGDEDAKIFDCNVIHQQELHNCGVYVINFVELILMGKSFREIQNKNISFEDIEQIRELYAWRMAKAEFPSDDDG